MVGDGSDDAVRDRSQRQRQKLSGDKEVPEQAFKRPEEVLARDPVARFYEVVTSLKSAGRRE